MTTAARAEESPPTVDRAGLQRDERRRLEEGGPATVKMFVAALRQRFSDQSAGDLRRFIDPKYLKDHGLQNGAFPIRRVAAIVHPSDPSLQRESDLIVIAHGQVERNRRVTDVARHWVEISRRNRGDDL